MNPDPVINALWIGSLLAAADPAIDPLPTSLDEFVTAYLVLVRSAACSCIGSCCAPVRVSHQIAG